jgi:WD40 repeat protein
MQVDEEITATYVTHDGKFAVIGTAGGKVHFYNLKRGTSLGSTTGGSRRITAVAFSPDGNGAISGNDDGQLVLYSFGSGAPQPKALGTISDDVSAINYSADGLRVFALALDGNVYQYNPVTGASAGGASRTGISRAMAMALSPDGKLLAVGGRDAKIAVFDIPAMTLKKMLQGPGDDQLHRVGFDENSKFLIAGSNGNGVGMWETSRLGEKYTKQYEGMGEWARGAGFTPDGRCAAVFDSEIGISMWDRETGIRKHELKFSQLRGDGDEILVTAGCIGPDGTALVATKSGRLFHFTLTSN